MNIRLLVITVLIFGIASCTQINRQEQDYFEQALNNGRLVNEGYTRCLSFVEDWLNYADSTTGLIPENLDKGIDFWSPHNSAADNYPFMVLTAYLLDKDLYNGTMLDILNSEKAATSRLGTLPDIYSFSKQTFKNKDIDTTQIIFGASEYIKDGLIPLAEYIGITPWSERLLEMLDDLAKYVKVAEIAEGEFWGNSVGTEINGELLQTLSRVYWMTGDKKYLNWAIAIGDYYLLENPDRLLKNVRLRLRDHGCEIVGGLSELYTTLHFADRPKKEVYKKTLYEFYDRILEVGRNEDGMFYNEVNMVTGEVVDPNLVDNWGYLYNAYYTLYLIDDHDEYRKAVICPFENLNLKYGNYSWEGYYGSDGFADAIESGINLYNRERNPDLEKWIDREIKMMWELQDSSYRENAHKWRNRGIIEGWHGDGNFARTTIMYCLWKTKGFTIQPWRSDLLFGTHESDGSLYIALKAESDWEGTLFIGNNRHKENLHLPIDYPRINQFPEWFVVDEDRVYSVKMNKRTSEYSGTVLKEGTKIKLKSNLPYYVTIEKPLVKQ